jgi:acetyl esterase/lipase
MELNLAREVHVERDIVYGHARVNVRTTPSLRPLRLDRYAPADASGQPRPVLLMAFGGAFHRGTKEADEFGEGQHRNTPVSSYCREMAEKGWVACSIDYRLAQEDPDPGDTHVIGSPARIPMSRVNHVRGLLSLPPALPEDVWATVEAATDDMAAAFRFVQAQAVQWNVDPDRIVVGGFSAGARVALGAAYGEGLPAAGVVSLSGFMADDDLDRLVRAGQAGPPALLVHAENDLDYVRQQSPAMARHFLQARPGSQAWQVPGATHFYPAGSEAIDTRTGRRSTVGSILDSFLARCASRSI